MTFKSNSNDNSSNNSSTAKSQSSGENAKSSDNQGPGGALAVGEPVGIHVYTLSPNGR